MEEIKITALDPLEGVRRRPGTYIGPVNNPNVLLREVVDNSIDECLANHANEIHVFSNAGLGGIYSGCYDNGRGIPITLMEHNKTMQPQFKVAVSSLHAGSKFMNIDKDGSVGMNGLGTKAVNALSIDFYIASKITDANWDKSTDKVRDAWTNKVVDNLYYCMHFSKGKFVEDIIVTVDDLNERLGLELLDGYSTYTIFSPDDSIFHSTVIQVPEQNFYYLDAIMKKFYDRSDLKVVINGTVRDDIKFEPYKYTLCKTIELDQWKTADEKYKDRLNKKLSLMISFEFDKELNDLDSKGSVNSLATMGKNCELGEKIVTQGLKSYYGINHNYLTLGLKIVTVLMIGEAEFDSQTKVRLTNIPGMTRTDWQKFDEDIYYIYKKNPEIWDHVMLLNEYAAQKKALTTRDLVKSKIFVDDGGKPNHKLLPVKLRDALSKSREDCILMIVEGDSAGAGLIKMRDPMTVGILPLRGVPLNSTNLDITETLENQEMCDLFSAIGMGAGDYTSDKGRYGKIVIAADADIDGLKIAALILGALLKHNPMTIEKGMVYLANAPLYRQGDSYIYSEAELNKNKPYKRFKGLGEMNSDEIRDSLLDPKRRRFIQVTPEGAEYALRLISNKEARKDLMREIGCLSDILSI
jgi:DNA gyrase subunit B